jgi:beta-lysine N6-acetyltransferase
MSDRIDTLGHSIIQHGKFNDRIYLMKLVAADLPELLTQMDHLADKHHYSKIFAKVPASAKPHFAARGYLAEAKIPQFFRRQEDVIFFSKFLTKERREEKKADLAKKVLQAASQEKGTLGPPSPLPKPFHSRIAVPQDSAAMAEAYRQVFPTYPFPIHDPAYLQRTMEQNVAYFGIWHGEQLVALASAEMDLAEQNAEMTDFATLPEYRGKGLANCLLAGMENYLACRGITTAYTIARAYSYGMNITFARQGYCFSGSLVNNTNICGGLESMNVWHKPVQCVGI